MALKSLARKDTTYAHAKVTTYSELEKLIYLELTFGNYHPNKHRLVELLDGLSIWHREPLERFRHLIAQLEGDHWYEATRYPEDFSGRTKTRETVLKRQTGFSESDVTTLHTLTADVLRVVGTGLSIVPPISETET